MLRKAVRIAATLILIGLGYVGYERGFAALARLVNSKPSTPPIPFSNAPSAGQRQAGELALRAWGKDHWSLGPGVLRYYDPPRGFWMYAGSYEPFDGNKKLKMKPFSLLWRSTGDPSLKSLCADEAIVEFEKPMELGKMTSDTGHIIWARITGNVVIRNDKGTPSKIEDDLTIGPVSYLTFDEKTLKITSDQPIFVKDQNMRATGIGLVVSLAPKAVGLGGGFDPTAVRLETDVRIDMDDVRGSGIVPGGSEAKTTPGQPAAKRPGVITSLGPMDIFLPPNRRIPRTGPPAPKGPTRAEFRRKVEAKQGLEQPDQLNSDFLELTLVEPPKPTGVPNAPGTSGEDSAPESADDVKPAASAAAPPPPSGGLGNLTLVAAKATGHAVWLQSPAQGMRGLGNEMIYRRGLPPESPDEVKKPDVTHFWGNHKTEVEKITYVAQSPDEIARKVPPRIESIDNIEAADFTIYQYGPDIPPQIVSAGPGTLETRADRGKPIERTAYWETKLEVVTIGEGEGARRKITLTGRPRVTAPSQADISATDTIIAMLKPKAKTLKGAEVLVDGQPRKADPAAPAKSGDAWQIEWAQATGNAHLISYSDPDKDTAADPKAPKRPKRPPTMNVLDAREVLTATFVEAPPSPTIEAPKTQVAAAAVPAATPPPPPEKTPEPEIAPAKPPMIAKADRVWTRIMLRPEDESKKKEKPESKDGALKGDVEWARLRGAVTVHQDPDEGKKRGTDIVGDKVDYENRGEDRALIKALGTTDRAATASTDGFFITGPLLGLDQSIDFAWVEGPGMLIQEAQAAEPKPETPARKPDSSKKKPAVAEVAFIRLDDEVDEPKAETLKPDKPKAKGDEPRPAASKAKGPMTVTWTKQMKFYGHTVGDGAELGPGRAEFYDNVHAKDDESDVTCDTMIAMLDAPVSFHRAAGKDDPRDPERETGKKPQAKINRAYCTGQGAKGPVKKGVRPFGVDIVQREIDPETKKLRKRRVVGDDVIFNKAEGKFDVKGDGFVWLYDPHEPKKPAKDDKKPAANPAALTPGSATARPRTVRPVADVPRPAEAPKPKEKAAAKKSRKKLPPPMTMDLTRIRFYTHMAGTFDGSDLDPGSDKDKKKVKGPSQADFWGSVQVLRAPVLDEHADLDPDALYLAEDEIRLNCKVLRVESIPSEDGDKSKDRKLMTAWEDVTVNETVRAIKGETLTYDSSKELYWVYGAPGRPAMYTDNARAGVAGSSHPADAFMLNRITGENQAINPQNILLADPRTGGRYAPAAPDPRIDTKEKRKPFRIPSRVDKERRGFTGR